LFDLSFRFLFSETGPQEGRALYFNIGYGKFFPIIPNIMSPGIYIDAGLGMDWLYLFSLFSGNSEPKKNDNQEKYQWGQNAGSNLGLRLFNLIEIGVVDIIMFTGYSLSILRFFDTEEYKTIHNSTLGVSLAFRLMDTSGQPIILGLEYAYYIPTSFTNRIAFHHIALVIRGKSY
jgi:hypothetical protein